MHPGKDLPAEAVELQGIGGVDAIGRAGDDKSTQSGPH